MVEVLILATLLVPITSGLVQAVKISAIVDKRFIPLVAILIGVLLGASAFF